LGQRRKTRKAEYIDPTPVSRTDANPHGISLLPIQCVIFSVVPGLFSTI
jgi:hypothetical protein